MKKNNHSDTILAMDGIKFTLIMDSARLKEHKASPALHSHRYYELFYIGKGDMQIEYSDQQLTVPCHGLAIIPPRLMHRTSQGEDAEIYNVEFQAELSALPGAMQELLRVDIPRCLHTNPALQNAFLRLGQYFLLKTGSRKALMGLCFQEILYLLRDLWDGAAGAGGFGDLNGEYRGYFIDNYLNGHFAGAASLAELAETVHLSQRQVNYIIQKTYGQSFHQRILSLRMENAARLLSETTIPIQDIAARVGYASVHGFYSAFRKHCGMTPQVYRCTHR